MKNNSYISKCSNKLQAVVKRTDSEETRRKKSIAAKNRPKRQISDRTRLKISIANTGKTRTDEARKKMSEAKLGKRRSAESVAKSSAGLKGKKKPITQCPHCKINGGISAMTRWHFDKCKFKEI